MKTNQDELNHLKNGEVFFPPQVLLKPRTHRRHHVIEVHYNVYQRIARQKETLREK